MEQQVAVLTASLAQGEQSEEPPSEWELLARLHTEVSTRAIPVIITASEHRLLDRAEAEAERYGGGTDRLPEFWSTMIR